MKNVYVTRRAHFNAAHKLWNEDWSEEKNMEVFGKCANPNWHGHNYELHVTIKGEPAEETGYCMNLKELKDIIKEKVEEPIDHKNLNLDVPFLKGKKTSTECSSLRFGKSWSSPFQSEAASCTTFVCTRQKTTTPTTTAGSETLGGCKIWSRLRAEAVQRASLVHGSTTSDF